MRNDANPISSESVLRVFHRFACIDLRKLAVELGVDAANAMLRMVVGDLERNGKIRRIGGVRGRHTLFVLATFEG
ncbi:MAG: hypothetical protein PHP05_00755 [Sideroxydans sp.]|nr:hypothetical protein [Sideroxydans sp.]MDD5470433.1 hypothetical protein [Sideroxydans sp.]